MSNGQKRDQEAIRPSARCTGLRQWRQRGHGVAGRGMHVMALLQGIKKLFGHLLDDLDYVSGVKEAMALQVEACM